MAKLSIVTAANQSQPTHNSFDGIVQLVPYTVELEMACERKTRLASELERVKAEMGFVERSIAWLFDERYQEYLRVTQGGAREKRA